MFGHEIKYVDPQPNHHLRIATMERAHFFKRLAHINYPSSRVHVVDMSHLHFKILFNQNFMSTVRREYSSQICLAYYSATGIRNSQHATAMGRWCHVLFTSSYIKGEIASWLVAQLDVFCVTECIAPHNLCGAIHSVALSRSQRWYSGGAEDRHYSRATNVLSLDIASIRDRAWCY